MYLDNAATTPLLSEVKDEVMAWLNYFGNPSSEHEEGLLIKRKLNECRNDVAKFINGNADNIIFTSSGSAANNLVINGLNDKYLYLYTPTCHKSMRLACENKPFHKVVQMDNKGIVDINKLELLLRKNKKSKIVFCYEMTNSEIGVCQNNIKIKELIKSYDGIIVADATAYIPHFKLYANQEGADFYTFSAHKIGALKGVGVVYYNSMEQLKPLIFGSQERGLFGGTENVIGIISLGTAVKYWYQNANKSELVAHFISDEVISKIPDSYEIANYSENKVSNIMMFCFKNVRGDELLTLLNEDGFYVSTGSACNSGSLELSPTLLSIRVPESDIPCCIRVSITGNESISDIRKFIESLKKNVEKLRLMN